MLELVSGDAHASGADSLDHIHVATALHRLATHSTSRAERSELAADPRTHQLLQLLSPRVKSLNAQGVANTLWALAKLSPELQPPPDVLQSLTAAAASPSLWAHAAPQAVSNTAWAHAHLSPDKPDRRALNVLAAAAMRMELRAQELSNLLWAFGTARMLPEVDGWAASMWAAVEKGVSRFSATELSIVLWSFARLEQPGGDAMLRAVTQLAQRAGECDMQAVANALWALTKLKVKAPDAVAALVKRAEAVLPLADQPRSICNVLIACALLRHDPGPERVGALVSRTLAMQSRLNAQDVAQLCGALMQLRYAPSAHALTALVATLDAHLAAFSASQLETVCEALRRFDYEAPQEQRARLRARREQLRGASKIDAPRMQHSEALAR